MRQNRLPQRRHSAVWTILGTALGLALLYVATRKIEAEALLATLQTTDLFWTTGVLASVAGFVATKAWRWAMLLRFAPGVSYSHLHATTYVGLAVNFLVSHMGEFLRAATVARHTSLSISTVFASVVVERALDFLALLIILSLLTISGEELPPFVETALLVTAGIAALGVVGLYTLLNTPSWIVRLFVWLGRPLPQGLRVWFVTQFTLSRTGLIAIRNVRRMIFAISLSVLQWVLVLLAIWCSVRSIGETATVVPVAATLVLVLLGLMLPNSPMQIGTTQLAFTIGLGTGGIMATAAIAASLVYTLFLILPIMIVGGVCLMLDRRVAGIRIDESIG